MEILNGTPFLLEATQATEKSGQALLVILVKGTFDFPAVDGELPLAARQQVPVLVADLFEGEPGVSTPLFECDYAMRKRRCDVIVRASACAPQGQPVSELDAAFRVGTCEKWVHVVGDRVWQRGVIDLKPSAPQAFVHMPITYGRAYGGSCEERGLVYAQEANPIGRGYAGPQRLADLHGQPLPNLEQPGAPIERVDATYTPWSFGPIGRSWQPRLRLAGTYDDHWQEEIFPLLPADFDEGFFQCAPPDQQIGFPRGGEDVRLLNLHPSRPHIHFPLPNLDMPLAVLDKQQKLHFPEAVVDTVTLDAESAQLIVTWRAQLPLKRNLREVQLLAGGNVCRRWWKSRVLGTADCGCGGVETDDEDLAPVTAPLHGWDEA